MLLAGHLAFGVEIHKFMNSSKAIAVGLLGCMLSSFLIGYFGGLTLEDFGPNIWIVLIAGLGGISCTIRLWFTNRWY